MDFGVIAKRAEKLVANNSPALLTAIGVTGTVVTAVLTGKASVKAFQIIEREQRDLTDAQIVNEEDDLRPLEPKEKFALVWKCYIPPFISGVLTIAAIIGANRIGTRRAAALASAYSLTEKAFGEYRDKITEKMGEKKEQAARDEMMQERLNETPLSKSKIVLVDNDSDFLCYDAWSGRPFLSSKTLLENAEIDINRMILSDGCASLSEFYSLIGLPPTEESDEVGWGIEKKFKLDFYGDLTNEGRPCLAFSYTVRPIRNYHKLY